MSAQAPGSPQQTTTHRWPAPHSELDEQTSRQAGMKHSQSVSVVWAHRQPAPGGPHSFPQGSEMQSQTRYCAKAGVVRLVMTGAVHATAAPAPMRFSIRRRLILSSDIPHLLARLWSAWPDGGPDQP
jgi:hypothetical protein